MLSKLSCQESNIDGMDRYIKELHGKVDQIAEDVQKLVNMKKCSHCQETIANGLQPMEEVLVSKHVPGMEAKYKK